MNRANGIMATESTLAVILHADVMGSAALVQVDERIAHERIRDAFNQFSETVASHGGTTLELRGDALLAEFSRASDAVSAALAFQLDNARQNEKFTDGIQVNIRIGIALGEVVIADGTVTGPGVVLAQRIEQLARGGGICVSSAVVEAVPKRLPVTFNSLGDQSLKGFDEAVRVYFVETRLESPAAATPERPAASSPTTWRLSDLPSIAVLPFDNLSADPDQEYFADGMTEDIITGLSRFRSLLVTARNSTFAYKSKSTNVREVATALGARYVLEGSVRCAGQRIRITAQLIDASTGNHLWAERYDRELRDIFAVQDEVTEAIIGAIAPEIGNVERKRAQRNPPESLDATFAPAFSMAANARWRYVVHYDPDDRNEYLNEALQKAQVAMKLDPQDPTAHWAAGEVYSILGDHDVAVSRVKEAIRLNPNDAVAHYFLGSVLRRTGRSEEAIPHIDHAMHLSPRDIWITGMLTDRAFVLFDLERYEEALDWAQRARLSPNPRTMTFAIFAGVLSKLGRHNEARLAAADFMKHVPGMTCTKYRKSSFGTPEAMERLVEAPGKAGVPE